MNVSSLAVVARLFSVDWRSVMISSVEFNHDYKNLRLDGVKSISVDSLVSQFKVYQKREGLRLEHKTKVPLSVENVVDMLSNQPNLVDLNVKLSQQREALDRLNLAMRKNSELFPSHDRTRKSRSSSQSQ